MKRQARLFVEKNGVLTIEDPSSLEIEVLRQLGIKLEGNTHSTKLFPGYKFLKDYRIQSRLPQNINSLLSLHNQAIPGAFQGEGDNTGQYNLFDLKRRLFENYLKNCCLCGYKCMGKRSLSGKCSIGKTSYYYQHFIHVGEEKEIGRTLVIDLSGCNIRCKFCQKGELIEPDETEIFPFTSSLWEDIRREYRFDEFDNISFLGGNPDQSFLAVLDFLENAPYWAGHLPIIWHTNGYSTEVFYNLLWGLVDILVFDFKYFNNSCAFSLSQAPEYKERAISALKTICEMKLFNLVIVRHLLLPGHWECCQRPLIEHLRGFKNDIIFHPMAQYKPAWKITDKDGELSRPINKKLFTRAKEYALNVGLTITE